MEHRCEDTLCEICGADKIFDLPDEIVAAAKSKNLILFLGAGVSTENPQVTPSRTFYQTIASSLGDSLSASASFPEVMEAYERANSRKSLIEQIYLRFQNVRGFRNSVFHSTRFFHELATMPYIDTIFTTNWDTNVEDYCAATPFISGQDVALWEVAERKVLKIHGSISNLGSIVATSEDYRKNFESLSKGFLGGFLRTALATKTVVFIGYSLRDWNILNLYGDLIQDLGIATPNAYKVSPNAKLDSDLSTIKPVATSGIHFLRALKERMVSEGYLKDDIYEQVEDILDLTHTLDPRNAEDPINPQIYPNVIYAWFYNDGLRDALDRILRFRSSGQYSDRARLHHKLHSYDDMIERAEQKGLLTDAAYLMGYWDGLAVPFRSGLNNDNNHEADEDKSHLVPLFQYDAEYEIENLSQLKAFLESTKDRDDEPTRYIREMVQDLPEGFVFNHSSELSSGIFYQGGSA